jgi:hypothetical protein
MLGHQNLKVDDELDMLIRDTKNATRIMARKLLAKKDTCKTDTDGGKHGEVS